MDEVAKLGKPGKPGKLGKQNKPADGKVGQYFVCIGAQKSGTTWLNNYFQKHPQVFVPAIKEIHYFDAVHAPEFANFKQAAYNQVRRFAEKVASPPAGKKPPKRRLAEAVARVEMLNDPKAYVRFFEGPSTRKKAFGEITPSYAALDENGFRAILDCFPEAKFIFLMRNPTDRYWSSVRRHLKKDPTLNVIKAGEKRLEKPEKILRTDYQRTLETLYRVVKPEKVLVAFYEDIFGPKGESVVRRITDFLGVNYVEPKFEKVINPSPSVPMPPALRAKAIEKFANVYQYVLEKFGDEMPENWRTDMAQIPGPQAAAKQAAR